ncbi:MAG: hypothetical protein R2706_09485 [Acidimicrobiales bacterium]
MTEFRMAYAEALTEWGDLGGYDLESKWAAAAARSVKTPVDDFSTRLVRELSGGERKRLVLDLLLSSVPMFSYSTSQTTTSTYRRGSGSKIRLSQCRSVMVSHDRSLLEKVATKVVVIEGPGAWSTRGFVRHVPRGARSGRNSTRRRTQAME